MTTSRNRNSRFYHRLGLALIVASIVSLVAASSTAVEQPATPDTKRAKADDITETDPKAAAEREAELLSNVRQLTFEGRRAGEGYFSADGTQMVFQSEREPGNPFFQIYLMDRETGDVQRISRGYGKTTCAWIHPDGRRVLFASTHEDPEARQKQAEEIRRRKAGHRRRYSWDYDEHYDIYVYDRQTQKYTNATHTRGYDAEGSFSPDGKLIAFTSNRRAYGEEMSPAERKKFEQDPAYMMDVYIARADGSNVRRLTTAPGYDGGPFFSPDGRRICWRHFSESGAVAEIMTMNVDGSDKRQLTRLGAMSWAPFYHPSGQYLIFTTNRHGFANFELYLVDAEGKSTPVRVTYTAGFDGLPVFTPDGRHLAWTTNRTARKQAQIFLADFDDHRAGKLLGLDRRTGDVAGANRRGAAAAANPDTAGARAAAAESSRRTTPEFSPEDIRRHVAYLCREELAGRLTGTRGERLATAYVAAYFDELGLEPAGDDGSWFEPFPFTAGAALGENNSLAWGEHRYVVDRDWRPIAFSKTGKVAPAAVVFAGYGIAAPKTGDQREYDSFVHLDVAGKWALVFRYLPEGVSPERRQHLAPHSHLRYKAMVARDKGARGLIVVSGPNSKVKSQLVLLRLDGSLSGTSIPVLSVTDHVAEEWLKPRGKTLKALQDKLDAGEPAVGFELPDVRVAASIDVRRIRQTGRNVLGRLQAGDKPSTQALVVGAHVDHLGRGLGGSSLARDDEKGKIHFGADDNASGVAAVLEIAAYLADQKARGRLAMKRDILFAAWSGEELGTIGSNYFVKSHRAGGPIASDGDGKNPHSGPSHRNRLYPAVAACLNLDMVGRLRKKLILQGIGSSSVWRSEIERRNAPVGLPITLQDDCYLPSDATAFYVAGVPILSAFTGSHGDYHTPRDTPEKLNYTGVARIARLMGLVARGLAIGERPPAYVAQSVPNKGRPRAGLRAYLGTIPDYGESDAAGVRLSGVAKGGPAEKAGVRGGDLVVELAGKKIENIYDYTYAIEALKIGRPAKIAVIRAGKRLELTVTPASRE